MGAGLQITQIKQAGWHPSVQGVLLWVAIGVLSLITIESIL